MEMKGALTMNLQSAKRTPQNTGATSVVEHSDEDFRYYFQCPLRKNHARIPVTVCHKQKCLWLATDGGKTKCGYGDPNASVSHRPKVKKISRDGVL